ncbi:MAG: hypothetical protein H5T73_06655 [Actinobacteria bacterium]|nr:hypothetical protein [Actinomycetota bacterium]
MPQCVNHPERSASARCAGCGRELCEQCVELREGEEAFCYDCAVERQLSDLRSRRREEGEREREAFASRRKVGSRGFIVMAAILSVLVLSCAGFLVYGRLTLHSGRAEATPQQELTRNRDECILSMQAVRDALARYREEKGQYPSSLQELKGAYLDREAACPATGAPYAYSCDGLGYRLSCPNPGAHEASGIEADEGNKPRVTE